MQDVFAGEEQEFYAAEMCLRIAYKRLKDRDIDLAVKRAEEALRSLKALQEIQKAN